MMRVVLTGGARERGQALGRAVAGSVRAFLSDGQGRTDLFRDRPLDPAQLAATMLEYAACVRAHLPDIAEEVEGFAEGAGIPLAHAWLLQYRRELINAAPTDCTTYARGPLLGQTIDLSGGMRSLVRLVEIHPPEGPRSLLLTFAGLLGYIGLNDAGLAVAINMVLAGPWRTGVSPYLLSRAVLAQDSLEEAVALLERVPHASSRCLTLAQGERLVSVELTGTERYILPGPERHYTNHLQHPQARRSETASRIHRMESRLRLGRLKAATRPPPADALALAQVLDQDAFQKPMSDNPADLETVVTVVMEPASARLHARLAGQRWHLHTFGESNVVL